VPPLVAPEYRPTLREELAPRPRGVRRAVYGLIGVATLAAVVAIAPRSLGGEERIIRARPIAFNLRPPPGMDEVRPGAGEVFKLERPGLDSFSVAPLRVPAYRGDPGGILPVVAARELDALQRRFPGFEPVEEGKARVNEVPAYSIAFRISRSPRQYGRLVLLLQPVPGARDGVKLLLTSTPKAGAGKAADVGVEGQLKIAYRSFRFGTELP
jgi:hypothetical protein